MAAATEKPSTATATDAVHSTSAISKRKRSDDEPATKKEDANEQARNDSQITSENWHAFLKDVHDILKSQDARLQLLETPLSSTTPDPHPAKRAKLVTPATKATIATKIQDQLYVSIEELVADFDNAASKATRNKVAPDADTNAIRNGEAVKLAEAQAARFKSLVNELVCREMVQKPQTFGQTTQGTEEVPTKDGGINIGLSSSGKMMLTLFGKGDSHYSPSRQLFSSLQQPLAKKEAKEEGIDQLFCSKTKEEKYAPLRETALPNGIFASKNIPTSIGSGKSKVPTIGTLFPAPSNLPQLTPPRQSKHTTTRDKRVTFYEPKPVMSIPGPRSRTDHYTKQPLPTGQWIGYSSAPAPDLKKKKRGQSFNELTSPSADETPAKHQPMTNDELFKNVYSSFAPIRDDSTALIPETLKNRVWWDRYGSRRFHSYLDACSVDYSDGINGVLDQEPVEEDLTQDQINELEETIKAYELAELPPEFQNATKASAENDDQVSEKDVDEVLSEISDAIESLVAHQRARNLISTSSTPTPAGLGSPSTPSTAELDVYNLLKNQLKIMISSLPPYAVAKLNGDQLESLAISTRMPVQGEVGRGVMEDPEALGRTRATATTIAAIPPVVRQTYPSRSTYNGTPAASSSRYTATNNYNAPRTSLAASYPSQTYSGRDTPTAHFSSYPPQQSSTARRPFAGNQPHHGSYTNGLPPRTSTYSSSHQYSTATPQRSSQPNYQHRPPNSTPSYSNYNATTTLSAPTNSYSSYNNHVSAPANSASYTTYTSTPRINNYASHPHASSSRATYTPSTTAAAAATSSANAQANSSSRTTTTSSAEATRTANPMVDASHITATTTVGQRMGLTPEEQAMLMRRQKEQLALRDQQQARYGPNGPVAGMESSRFARPPVAATENGY